MQRVRVINTTRGTELGDHVGIAGNFWTRFAGLMGRGSLAPGDGLHILPCSSVHMFFMRIPLDLVYLDASGRVVKAVANLRPWRLSAGRGAKSVIELPVGTIAGSGTVAGDQLELVQG